MSTPKTLHSETQGKRHELRECRANLGHDSNEPSVATNTIQPCGTLPRRNQAAGGFRPRRHEVLEVREGIFWLPFDIAEVGTKHTAAQCVYDMAATN